MGCGNVSQIRNDNKIPTEEKQRLELLSSKSNIRDVYNFQGVLGKGGFGTVKLAVMKNSNNDKKVAVKIIEKSRVKNKQYILLREFETLKTLDHPNIIKFYEVYQDEMFFYICMEYCAGGELLERITQRKYFKEKEAATIMEKLFSAVNHMHIKGIVHRDLKPENILFSTKNKDSDLKIIDFGLANKFDGKQQLSTMVGTPLYVSPAVLRGKYDKSCDNWSLGVILYILLVGYPPFYGDSRNEIFQKIQSGKFTMDSKEWTNVSNEAKDLVKKLLVVDPKKIIQIPDALRHPWILQFTRRISKDVIGGLGAAYSIANLEPVDPKVLNLLKNFRTTSKFKTEVMKVLVNQLNEREIEQLKNAFKQFDLNQTGLIKINDLQIVMEQAGFKHTKEEIERIVKNVSPESQNGGEHVIQYSEFIAATLDQIVYLKSEKIWSLFKYFDQSNNNYITIEDLKEIFLRNGRNIPEAEIRKMVQEVDPNNDGKISLEEFKQLMIGEEVDYKA